MISSTMSVRESHRRDVGFFERYFIGRNVHSIYTNVGVVTRLNHLVSAEVLSNALRSMILQNPWLVVNYFSRLKTSYQVRPEDYEARFINEIKFLNVVSFETVPSFNEDLLEKMDKQRLPLDSTTLPLWRIVVYTVRDSGEQYVCGCFDHTIFDGLASVEFLRDLVKELSYVKEADSMVGTLFEYSQDAVRLPERVPLCTELKTDLFSPSFSGKILQRLYDVLVSFIPSFFKRNSLISTGIPITKDTSSKFKIVRFEQDEVRRITEFCRLQNFTLTPFFHCVGINCLESHFYNRFRNPDYHTLSLIAINGRRYFPEFAANFNYSPTVLAQAFRLPPTVNYSESNIITLIRDTYMKMAENLISRETFKSSWSLSYQNLLKLYYSLIGSDVGKASLITSNLGKVENKSEDWTIEEIWFVLNTSVTYNFLFNMITSPAGVLNLVIPHSVELSSFEIEVDGKLMKAVDHFAIMFKRKVLSFVSSH